MIFRIFLFFLFLSLLGMGAEHRVKRDRKMADINIFKDIFLSIDRDLKLEIKDIYLSEKYDALNIKEIRTEGSLDAVNNLRKSQANIAIVRGDILGIKNNGLFGIDEYKGYGIVCSPSRSVLYLVSKKEIHSLNDIRGMEFSTGLFSNMAQVYLNDIMKNSGLSLEIGYNSIDLDDSIDALKKDQIDAIFMFAPEKSVYTFLDNNLKIRSLPDDFFDNLSIGKGLNTQSYEIDDEVIRTLEVDNFIIAPKTTLDENIDLKVEALVSAFECYLSIQNIDLFYGELHSSVKKAFSAIHKRVDKEDAIVFSFESKEITATGHKHIYKVQNHANEDMNITFDAFETRFFDNVPIRPRHLLTVVPANDINLKKKSHKFVTFIYENPFAFKVEKNVIQVQYKNKTIKKSDVISFELELGDTL